MAGMHLDIRRFFLVMAAAAWCGTASAMEKCRELPDGTPTRPCATPMEVLALQLLPLLLAIAGVALARRKIARPWLRTVCVGLTVFLCAAWELIALGALQGFLAPCSATCWL